MNSREPMVSVVMAAFNAEKYLSQSIDSILSQTYENLELIIVDDGSTDNTWGIISKFQGTDQRIRPVRLKNNHGVAVASNTGLKVANGKYIARMDADDISLPERIEKQVDFLEGNPLIGVLGSRVRYIDELGNLLGAPPVFQGDLSIRWHLLFENPFNNSTTMFRKSLVDRYQYTYEISALYGEDYNFWGRLLLASCGENLSEVLVYYRLHSYSLTYKMDDVLARTVIHASNITHLYFPNMDLAVITELQCAIKGYPISEKYQRAHLLPVYLSIWDDFSHKYQHRPELSALRREVYSWAARMILFPPFQKGSLEAMRLLTKEEWKWPLFLLWMLPTYWERRRI